MNSQLQTTIDGLDIHSIPAERLVVLKPFINYLQTKVTEGGQINLNLICTHNSRRSHLSQVWAQTMAHVHEINNVNCYSGGTEATAVFPKVIETLSSQGFQIHALSDGANPVYAIKYDESDPAIIGFSKTFDDAFNAQSDFAAVMTCSHADENCPFIPGANTRIALNYEDPKLFDGTPQQNEKYLERSLQIATEMKYVFSQLQ
ncbi:arsenate-mycothiol transferase ArsC [Winogradskyella aurantiaca]|uniref:arsenate-mycothiol transferase ArsC n=1 Tax=Winogradskyella aurantiaca TaxID=2219558 RepID=UPI000E1DB1C2|nr:protein-tyrosine-phosphatase [Winogradskyella aurantiaca]